VANHRGEEIHVAGLPGEWVRSRLRGLRKVGCEGYMVAMVHDVLKMVLRLNCGMGFSRQAWSHAATATDKHPRG
jgi:hypothetical protein